MTVKKIKPAQIQKSPPFKARQIFPPSWVWFVDEAIPTYTKLTYSPKEAWKTRPFTTDDVHFFMKGVEELSLLFTEERSKTVKPYFLHPKFRSSYLLYFLPLQAAKFLSLFEMYPDAIEAALAHGRKKGVLRILDIGAGPGTASIAFLLATLSKLRKMKDHLSQIEFYWSDTQLSIMKDGINLIEKIQTEFPYLPPIKVFSSTQDWWKEHRHANTQDNFSLIFMGHLLNEVALSDQNDRSLWDYLSQQIGGGGILLVEPASKKPSQTLSQLRDRLFASQWMDPTSTRLWGPCLHSEACPLASGRDWCHFSTPTRVPGKWFKNFSESLSSEKNWLKYSYLWIASREFPSPKPDPKIRRVISDPLSYGLRTSVLICEPRSPSKQPVMKDEKVRRGDLIPVKKRISRE